MLPPDEIDQELLEEYFAAVGMLVPNDNAFRYQDYITFAMKGSKDPELQEQVYEEHQQAKATPWTEATQPRAAKWVAKFSGELDKLVEGSKRPRYYQPYLAGASDPNEPFPRLVALLLPSIQQQREIAWALAIRAMGRIGSGDLDGAWSDADAMHRVAAHIGGGVTLIESLVAIAIKSFAFEVETHILRSPQLTDIQAKQFFLELKLRKPLPPIADRIDEGERYLGLDVVTTLVRNMKRHGVIRMLKVLNELIGMPNPKTMTTFVAFRQDKDLLQEMFEKVDWNETLVFLNQWYDRIVLSARETNYEKRRQSFAAMEKDLAGLLVEIGSLQEFNELLRKERTPKAMGQTLGKLLVGLLSPALDAASRAEERSIAKKDVLLLGFALSCYQRDHGSSAKSLTDLVPDYVGEIPLDACSGKKLKYLVTEDSAKVYSVAFNGRDDRGLSYRDAAEQGKSFDEWDDIVAEIPAK
ncbi:MAG: hypothetical protein AAF394_05410 [Planctomycetota bacterium]